jgi:dihydrofolate reductase
MRLAIIAAQSENRVIGRNNKLPWYLPEDLKYFKRVTLGKPIIMGRKTFESIGRPLPGRTNIIVTRNTDWTHAGAGVRVVHSLQQAIELAESLALVNGFEESLVIGGAEIYALALPMADRLYLTQVHAEVQGDAYFPLLDPAHWQEVAREDFSAIDPNPYDYSFIVLDRVGGSST